MEYQDHAKTHARLKKLREADGKFESLEEMETLFWVMPSDFSATHAIDFAYAIEQTKKVPNPSAGFHTIINAKAVKWIRENDPVKCAELIADCLPMISQAHRRDQVKHLLSGPFTYQLSYEMPETYANFFTKMVAALSDEDGAEFAEVKAVPDTQIPLYAVFPKASLRLPPYILVQRDDGTLKARAIVHELQRYLPRGATEAIYKLVEQEADTYSAQNNFDMAAVLSQSALYVKPQALTPS